mmetsp:Transcript_63093/g.185067  ORF Transcript_63093/g.185067 Transcript_63093/m.185067 type:complete len:221 (-) Transcript_63093:837-1499(-)
MGPVQPLSRKAMTLYLSDRFCRSNLKLFFISSFSVKVTLMVRMSGRESASATYGTTFLRASTIHSRYSLARLRSTRSPANSTILPADATAQPDASERSAARTFETSEVSSRGASSQTLSTPKPSVSSTSYFAGASGWKPTYFSSMMDMSLIRAAILALGDPKIPISVPAPFRRLRRLSSKKSSSSVASAFDSASTCLIVVMKHPKSLIMPFMVENLVPIT